MKRRDCRQFLPSANEGVYLVTERLCEMALNLKRELQVVMHRAFEEDVSAGDEGFDIREPEVLKQAGKVVHLDPAFAEINPAKKSDGVRH